ncbi:MAG: hypothetical protein ACR2K4_06645, partial [Candidatus Limnocylindria bacterium]
PGPVLDEPPALYCGIPQGRDPGELGARGCYLVEVGVAGQVTPKFVATDLVRWQPLEVPIAALADDESLLSAARQAIGGALEAADERSLVVRMRLTGRGPLHANLARTGYLDHVRLLLNEDSAGARPFAWVESVRDDTRPEIDLDARRQTPDFVGDFLRTVSTARRSARSTDPEEHERWKELLRSSVATLFEESPRGRRLLRSAVPSDDQLVGAILDDAEALGIDLLLAVEDEG